MKERKKYYIGLDMGTSSVGWAVTDSKYDLLRAKGKDMWGIREFEEAETASKRRTNRVSRRRRQREVARVGLLKTYFEDAINAVDADFYQRLENSKYHLEDKDDNVKTPNGIFNDEEYTDKDYFDQYPTIFHLRKELIESKEAHDVRLVYLAILNMFKHRGHFLNASLSYEVNTISMRDSFTELCGVMESTLGIYFDTSKADEVQEILEKKDLSRSAKAEQITSILDKTKKDKVAVVAIKAICGLEFDVSKLLESVAEFDEDKKIKIGFTKSNYEESYEEISQQLSGELIEVIDSLKTVYDGGVLSCIMKGYDYLSQARVSLYDKHAKDLKIVKNAYRRHGTKEQYNIMFRSDESGTYGAYVNTNNSRKKSRRNRKGRKSEDLYDSIKKFIKDCPEDEDVTYIKKELSTESLLPKQLTASNGVIPNQLHAREMRVILDNAANYLPFLDEVDESGLAVKERIFELFKFTIPYYVGPTSEESEKSNGNGWVVRREDGPVLPWNLEDKVDLLATNEKFISRMVRRCSYMSGKMVLPKSSLLYEKFCVLNEINTLNVRGERVSADLKQDIYNDLFKSGKKIKRKDICDYLYNRGVISKDEYDMVGGVDIQLNNTLSSYAKFHKIFGDKLDQDKYINMVERIIFLGTVYGDTKKFRKQEIEKNYGDILSQETINKIIGFKFRDWGRLSKNFLELPGCDVTTGEIVPLIRSMWEQNSNMMELLNSSQYTYGQELASMSKASVNTLEEFEYKDLNDLYLSSPVKRMVWQTILIVREIESIMGCEPEKIFVEMTRSEGEKKRTVSREKQFSELYKSIKQEDRDWQKVIADSESNGTIRSKKMFLYLTQMGRCMYTGDVIELDDLFNDNLYDIDHIYPRHFVKDDNISNNLVLVKKEKNAHKSDSYPLETSIRNHNIAMWRMLREHKLISEEKFKRLTSNMAFTEEQLAGFIARQLVETAQGTKTVANIVGELFGRNTEVVYVKASNVSDFRNRYRMYKCRSINDLHHANDAYLNIVVGNAYSTKFTKNPYNFIKNEYLKDAKQNNYNLSKMFDWDIKRGGYVAWEAGTGGTITTVKEMMAKNTPILSRMNFEVHGPISDQNIVSAQKATSGAYMPIKKTNEKLGDVTKYGGYAKIAGAYFALVEHTQKKKRVRTLESVPIVLSKAIEERPERLEEYCREIGLEDAVVVMRKIKMQSLVKKDGYLMHLSGKTGNRIKVRNAVSLLLDRESQDYVRLLEKQSTSELLTNEANLTLYETIVSKHINSIFAKKPNPMGEVLLKGEDKFVKLDLTGQVAVLKEMLKLSMIGATAANTSQIGGSANSGVMLINKKINNCTEFILINQSVTGLIERRIDLLTI